ncbi:B3 domain-containing transcription factor FUS3 [Trifolium repens]|nr:B3 domain-containing transcription factor FUS3 [Trifolium repens]
MGIEYSRTILDLLDNQTHNYVIQAKKACDQEEYMEGTSDTLINDIFIDDYEVNKCCFHEAYPAMNDTTIMSFIYDTTISNDSPLDFLGGSMTNYSRIGSVETFGSVENLSLDDFY